jgi:hypothetical protein
MPELDWTKPLQTKSGLKCKNTGIWLKGTPFNRVVIVEEVSPNPWQNCLRFNEDGKVYSDRVTGYDLINVPEERVLEGWVNIYPYSATSQEKFTLYKSKHMADREASISRIDCIHITRTYKVGEGLK